MLWLSAHGLIAFKPAQRTPQGAIGRFGECFLVDRIRCPAPLKYADHRSGFRCHRAGDGKEAAKESNRGSVLWGGRLLVARHDGSGVTSLATRLKLTGSNAPQLQSRTDESISAYAMYFKSIR